MASNVNPPFYVLLAHSSLSHPSSTALSNTLGHPVIQYHYADDSPLSLMPTHPEEHVLVLNYDPKTAAMPTVQSISENLSVTGLRLEEAPGAAVADESKSRNDVMFIIETTRTEPTINAQVDRKSVQSILAQFRHRNEILRKALQYPISSQEITSGKSETQDSHNINK